MKIISQSKSNLSLKFLFFRIMIIIQIQSYIFSSRYSCQNVHSYSDSNCFNNKIVFYDKYRAGHFETLKDGSLIIEYSNDGENEKRLFYALKKNGRYYFSEESPIKYFEAHNPLNINYNGRYESINKVVYLNNDTNKLNEFLFSTSSWKTVTELHDIERNISKYWDSASFWNNQIYSYYIIILDLPENNENHYLCVFNRLESYNLIIGGNILEYSKSFVLTKFKFDTFNDYTIINSTEYEYAYINQVGSRIISAFIVYEYEIIVIFFLQNLLGDIRYSLAFYDYNLNYKNEVLKDPLNEVLGETDIFFKAFLIKDRLAAFIYFPNDSNEKFIFEVGELCLYENNIYGFNYRINTLLTITCNSLAVYNDFFKVNEKRFALVTTRDNYKSLIFILFDIYNDYNNFIIRKYQFDDLPETLSGEIQGYTFNGNIILTFSSNEGNKYSTLLFFGYANGTDFSIDISQYIMDTDNYNNNYNLFDKLIENCVIDNNIFGYEIDKEINLVFYPEELLFYKGSGISKEENILPNNSILDANYTLYQNKAMIKTNKLYYLEYQFIVKEPNFEEFHESVIIEDNTNSNFINEYEQKTFYGRTNRLYFKLCNDYCESCFELGNQKCVKCLDDYSFDYWKYIDTSNNFCVSREYYYDKDEEKIIKCDDSIQFKFFKVSENKIICFKSDYICPPVFPILNTTTNECIKDMTIEQAIPSTNFQTIPSTNEQAIPSTNEQIIPSTIEKTKIKFQNLIIYIDKDDIGEDKLYEEEINSNRVKIASTKFFKDNMNMNKTTINLGKCEYVLKDSYNISHNTTLYILIIDINQTGMKIPRVEYEVFNIINYTNIISLNLSFCKNEHIEISIPVEIKDNIDKYNPKSGYYNDICYPAKSDFDTDINLDDRRKEFINNNMTLCEENCDLKDYDYINKKAKCSCFIKINLPIIDDVKINFEKLKKNFIDINTIANIECIKCYKRAFRKDILYNYGFYILTFIIILYLVCLLLFIFKFYREYKIEIDDYILVKNKNNKNKIINEIVVININNIHSGNENINLTVNKSVKRKSKNKKKRMNKKIKMLSENISKLTIEKSLKDKDQLIKEKDIKDIEDIGKSPDANDDYQYSDIELNLMPYKEALDKDKRSFMEFYLSALKINHLFLFSFYPNQNYNPKIIRMFLFFFFFSSHLTINAFFFIDSTIHQIYEDGGDFNLAYKIPIILYSTIISGIINAIIKYLSLSHNDIIKIKFELKNDNNMLDKKKKKFYKLLKIKYYMFFITCFIILLFFWFYIICFCSIYKNTQIHLIKDSIISFLLSFVYPFGIILLPSLLRIISLKAEKKNRNIIYKFSQLI